MGCCSLDLLMALQIMSKVLAFWQARHLTTTMMDILTCLDMDKYFTKGQLQGSS